MQIRELRSDNEDVWPQWWEIYSTSFPPEELEGIGYYKQLFRGNTDGGRQKAHVLSMETAPQEVAGIALVEIAPVLKIGLLWYIATRDDLRGHGLGSEFYEYIIGLCKRERVSAVVIEVDLPNGDPTSIENRRIAWYQRHGAAYVQGIRYWQCTSSSSVRVPMGLMVHELANVIPADIYLTLKNYFGERLQPAGVFRLTKAALKTTELR